MCNWSLIACVISVDTKFTVPDVLLVLDFVAHLGDTGFSIPDVPLISGYVGISVDNELGSTWSTVSSTCYWSLIMSTCVISVDTKLSVSDVLLVRDYVGHLGDTGPSIPDVLLIPDYVGTSVDNGHGEGDVCGVVYTRFLVFAYMRDSGS